MNYVLHFPGNLCKKMGAFGEMRAMSEGSLSQGTVITK